MSESAEAARPVTGERPTSSAGVSIGIADRKVAGVSIGVGGEKNKGVIINTGGGDKRAAVSIGIGTEQGAGVGTGGAKGAGLGTWKSGGATLSAGGGGEKSAAVSIGIGSGKDAGTEGAKSAGIAAGKNPEVSIGIGLEKSAGADTGVGGDKNKGASEKTGMGVSIPDSVVAPLIGAGANVYILTNELTQSMREKLGTSWPFVQDTLNSRYAKLLAGGLLASVAVIVVWKIIKRFTAKAKKPAEGEEDESCQWTPTKTYELTPVPDSKQQQVPRSEGDGAYPSMLPHKIQLRIAENPLKTLKAGDPELCKARDAATRHRHTRHPERRQGEPAAAGASYSPWHSEQPHDNDQRCSCPEELCASLPPQPRLLYSVKESRMVQRATNMADPHLDHFLAYASSPSAPCPVVLESVCPHHQHSKSYCLTPHTLPSFTPCVNLVTNRLSDGAPSLASYHPLVHSPVREVNLMSAPSHPSPCLSHHHGVMPNCLHTDANAGVRYIQVPCQETTIKEGTAWPGGVSVCSVEESQPMASASGITEVAGCQTLFSETESRCPTVESKARSVSQQTDGQPVEVDLDMPAHAADTPQSVSFHTGHNQSVPTRTAQSPVTPSQCTNTPIRTDNNSIHVHSSVTRPSRLSSFPQSCLSTVCQTPQGAVVQISAGGECPGSYPVHQHAMRFHTPHPPALDGFSSRALPAPLHLQPLTYHQHVSVDHVLPSLGQHQYTRGTPQQQQQPVVQHPSDSSVSQNSSEACPSQESRQYEGGHLVCGSQETAAPEVLSQERTLLPQQPHSRAGTSTPVPSPPRGAVAHHHGSSLRALTDYAHADYPWQGPHGGHSYQPTPLCHLGQQPSSSRYYSPLHNAWSAPAPMFVAPSFVPPSANLFFSSPAGMMAASPHYGLLPPSLQGQSMTSPWQAPYLSAHAPMTAPRYATFNSNFNLSNSNTHMLMQEAGQNSVHVLPFAPESSSLRVIDSDHSINSNPPSAAGTKAQYAVVSGSDVSLHVVGAEASEPPRNDVQHMPGSASGDDGKNVQSCETTLTLVKENSHHLPLHAVEPDNADMFEVTGAATEDGETLQRALPVLECSERPSSLPCSTMTAAASREGTETQL